MKKSEKIKEKIIDVTTEMIINCNGTIEEISTRAIADKADTSPASINYHFQTKDNLISICIQRFIQGVVSSFKPDGNETDYIKRFKKTVKSVLDFLYENDSISRISILDDMRNPSINDNTINTIKGFNNGLKEWDIPQNEKIIMAFIITSVIQSLFLRRHTAIDLLGIDLNSKSSRDDFIDYLIDRLIREN